MVATQLGWFGSSVSDKIKVDLYNIANKRNIRNTDKEDYNCGGYALNTFSWYMPFDEEQKFGSSEPCGSDKASIDFWAFQCVHFMLHELSGKVRLVRDVHELKHNEYAVAFRCGSYDFHFIKRFPSGRWYEKVGSYHEIRRCSKDILNPAKTWKHGKYTSKIFLLAVRANLFRRSTSKLDFFTRIL